ncbi:5451_t:CDS:2 [Paraglomus brasilianum]|uniref:5451_t:CDS:1 n=1 Tax=Paraglomus brasilianum TaxID=144538 RepID=A0A9N8YVE2_9GLOM|nr:5451_t:CDS:2 [Paraglomus brasilianum]
MQSRFRLYSQSPNPTLREFLETQLTESERTLIANPPLVLSIPLEKLIGNPIKTRQHKHHTHHKHQTKASLLYYQNYSAGVQHCGKAPYQANLRDAAKKWMTENATVRDFFTSLAEIKDKYAGMLASMKANEAQPINIFNDTQSSEYFVSDSQESMIYSGNNLSPPEMDLWLYTVNRESLEGCSDYAINESVANDCTI